MAAGKREANLLGCAANDEGEKDRGLTTSDIDWVIPHQANSRILEAVAQRLEVPPERMFLNIEKYGNTSSASIPIALDEAVRGGHVQRGDHLVMCALGGGLAWGSALVRW